MSSIDLLKWVKYLGIKQRCLFKRRFTKCGIINLDAHTGPGTHWVCYRNIEEFCEYFDSFGSPIAVEIVEYLSTSGKQIIYSDDEIQDSNSVLCDYWCLYFLIERQKGTSF